MNPSKASEELLQLYDILHCTEPSALVGTCLREKLGFFFTDDSLTIEALSETKKRQILSDLPVHLIAILSGTHRLLGFLGWFFAADSTRTPCFLYTLMGAARPEYESIFLPLKGDDSRTDIENAMCFTCCSVASNHFLFLHSDATKELSIVKQELNDAVHSLLRILAK